MFTHKTVRLVGAVIVMGFLLGGPGTAQQADTSKREQSFETFADQLPAGVLVEATKGVREVLRQGLELVQVYRKGIEEIKISEGLVPRLYNDAAGYCTIGYGHLIKQARCNGTEPVEFRDGVSKQEAEQLLVQDMRQAQIAVLNAVRIEMTDGQYAALVSFTFNVGAANFRNSTLLRVINSRQFDRVPGQFRRWNKARGVFFQGLANRREREIALFFDGQSIPRAVPRPDEDLSTVDISIGEGL